MKHIKSYQQLYEHQLLKNVVSFDFDGCLHTSVIDTHPINFDKPSTWEPFQAVIDRMREEAKNHRIVIVSARPEWSEPYMWEFIKEHKLPVSKIYCTNDMFPKKRILQGLGAIKHYDDKDMSDELKDTNVKFIKVDPVAETINENGPTYNIKQDLIDGVIGILFNPSKHMMFVGSSKNPDINFTIKNVPMESEAAAIRDILKDLAPEKWGEALKGAGYELTDDDFDFNESKSIINESFLFEFAGKGSLLLIYGPKMGDGKRELFLCVIEHAARDVERRRADNSMGRAANPVILSNNEIYRVMMENAKLKLVKPYRPANDPDLQKRMGIRGNSVVLNNNKTPRHWDITTCRNPWDVLSKYGDVIRLLPDVNFESR